MIHAIETFLLVNGLFQAAHNLLSSKLIVLAFSGSDSTSRTDQTAYNQQVESEYGAAYGAGSFSPTVTSSGNNAGGGGQLPNGSILKDSANTNATASGPQSTAAAGSIGQVINVTTTTSDVYAIQAAEAAVSAEQGTAETAVNGIEQASEAELTQAYESGVSSSFNNSQAAGYATPAGGTNWFLLAIVAGGIYFLARKASA
jgi:hypothetical protein